MTTIKDKRLRGSIRTNYIAETLTNEARDREAKCRLPYVSLLGDREDIREVAGWQSYVPETALPEAR